MDIFEEAVKREQEIIRLKDEISRLTENQRLQDSATAAVMERAEKAEAELAASKLDCGHPADLAVISAEEPGKFLYCELCNCRQERNDALQMEAELSAKLKQCQQDLNQTLADAQEEGTRLREEKMRLFEVNLALERKVAELAACREGEVDEGYPGIVQDLREAEKLLKESAFVIRTLKPLLPPESNSGTVINDILTKINACFSKGNCEQSAYLKGKP